MENSPSHPLPLPVISIIGSTGTGKSKLGIHVAKWLIENGRKAEIINVDAMQMYKGLPIATNQDQVGNGITHHMVAFLDPVKGETIDVVKFCNNTTELIERLLKAGVIPILVGGSNYYMQNILLVDNLVSKNSSLKSKQQSEESVENITLDGLQESDLHQLLKKIDPDMAGKYHPNDSRRIKRSIQIYQEEGIRHSEIIKQQQQSLRYSPDDRNVIFWTDCDRDVLYTRLNDRVSVMSDKGILLEAEVFWKSVIANHIIQDPKILPTTGIFGAIGFKELHPYLVGKDDAENCLETLKSNTRRYAKQQSQWIKNRFSTRNIQIFKLDTTKTSEWMTKCGDQSTTILQQYFNPSRKAPLTEVFSHLHQSSSLDPKNAVGTAKLFTCDICHKTLAGEDQYKIHITSRKHRSAAKRKEREPMIEKYKKLKEENEKDKLASEQKLIKSKT